MSMLYSLSTSAKVPTITIRVLFPRGPIPLQRSIRSFNGVLYWFLCNFAPHSFTILQSYLQMSFSRWTRNSPRSSKKDIDSNTPLKIPGKPDIFRTSRWSGSVNNVLVRSYLALRKSRMTPIFSLTIRAGHDTQHLVGSYDVTRQLGEKAKCSPMYQHRMERVQVMLWESYTRGADTFVETHHFHS